jgi:hypothetical protein
MREHGRGASGDPSLKGEKEHCKIKRVNPALPLRVHSADTKGLAVIEVG